MVLKFLFRVWGLGLFSNSTTKRSDPPQICMHMWYLEGQVDLVNRSKTLLNHAATLVIPLSSLLIQSPGPSK